MMKGGANIEDSLSYKLSQFISEIANLSNMKIIEH